MKKIILIFLLICTIIPCTRSQEVAHAITDKDCYLTGERLHVRVDITDENQRPLSVSKVAYIELTDAHRICAQGMAHLTDGRGWADITLPATMHSGNYQLSVYTREMRNLGQNRFFRKIVSVINALRVVRADDVLYLPADSFPQPTLSASSYQAKDDYTIQLSPEWQESAISLTRVDVQTPEYAELPELRNPSETKQDFIAEYEGHIVSARPTSAKTITQTRLVMVGRMADVYDGQWQADGTYLYYTQGLYGNLPTIINSYDIDGEGVGMEVVSPFAKVIPVSLPKLKVYCTEADLQRRSLSAQREQILSDWQRVDSLQLDLNYQATDAYRFYDLDEYTKFSTIREILIEFVSGVHRAKVGKVNQLFTIDPETHQYSRSPALVLLDGMPVHNIDDILEYDARLIKYVQVYTDRYTFGSSTCHGIISFISQRGRLSNYKIDAGSKLVSYQFPQNHPDFIYPAENNAGTLYWNPCITGQSHTLTLPSDPGLYQIRLQRLTSDGSIEKKTEMIEIK